MMPSPEISLATRGFFWRHQSKTACQPISTPAATSPPARLVSGPTMAFWTALAMMRSITRSNVDIWPSERVPLRRSPASRAT